MNDKDTDKNKMNKFKMKLIIAKPINMSNTHTHDALQKSIKRRYYIFYLIPTATHRQLLNNRLLNYHLSINFSLQQIPLKSRWT